MEFLSLDIFQGCDPKQDIHHFELRTELGDCKSASSNQAYINLWAFRCLSIYLHY